jgi:shikimate kinase
MKAAGKVIWLTASVETLWQRVQQDATTRERRPNLGPGGRTEIEQLAQKREPLYRDAADLEVSTEGRSPEEIASAILASCRTS